MVFAYGSKELIRLVTSSDSQVTFFTIDSHFPSEYEFNLDKDIQGDKASNFNIAFGLTAYDDNYEAIDDPRYAVLKARLVSWSPEVDATQLKDIGLHSCSREELGLDGNTQ